MSLKDDMMKKYQAIDAYKTVEQITDDIKELMKQDAHQIFYETHLLKDDVIKELEEAEFTVSDYEDMHSEEIGIKLTKISW